MGRRRRGSRGWRLAVDALRLVFEDDDRVGGRPEIGRVRFLGDGLHRRVFYGDVTVEPDPRGLSGIYVVLLPRDDVGQDYARRTIREADLLRRLASLDLPLRIPLVVGVLWDNDRPTLVETMVFGEPVDFKRSLRDGRGPWDVVGRVAATIHAVEDPDTLALAGDAGTWRDHATEALNVFDGLEGTLFDEARAWAEEHLPPPNPSVLLHGDLLGQNLRWPSWSDEDEPYGVIDWNLAERGDPAYDLAVVTQASPRPFKRTDGLGRLLDAYAGAGGTPLSPTAVRFHELCMAAGWYRYSLEPDTGGPSAKEEIKRFRNVFRRAAEGQTRGPTTPSREGES